MIIHVIKYTEKNNNRTAQSLYTNAKQMSNKTRTNSYKCWTEVFETRCMSGAWWAEIVLMSSKLATQLVACQTTFSHVEKRIIANMHRDWMPYVQHSFDICSRLKLARESKTVWNSAAWRALSHVVELFSFKTAETSDYSETFLMK